MPPETTGTATDIRPSITKGIWSEISSSEVRSRASVEVLISFDLSTLLFESKTPSNTLKLESQSRLIQGRVTLTLTIMNRSENSINLLIKSRDPHSIMEE